MDNIYLGRQPILDRRSAVVAYELLFRSSQHQDAADIIDYSAATAEVIVNSFCELGLQTVLGEQRGYINVNPAILASDVINLLPKNQVVLELEQGALQDEAVVGRCNELKQQGFRIALEGVHQLSPAVTKALATADVIKVDMTRVDPAALGGLAGALRALPCLKLASKIETVAQAEQCMKLGFDLFQGYYFARPEILAGKRADTSKLALLKLLSLVTGDAEMHALEEEFKRHPKLSYNLMRMVNSAATGLTRKIASLRQGIVILGQQAIARWIQLLLYTTAARDGAEANPLLLLVATRARTMEAIALHIHPNYRDYADRAFMVGLMSLLDTLLQMEMSEIIAQLSLPDDVRGALLTRSGPLGLLLRLMEEKEKNNVDEVSQLLAQLPALALADLVRYELEAAGWANSIDSRAAA
ncbi:MAG TPA: EAL domain-containing protein [Burkholderiales bacterium]|nr:EAL domain-containing protein [Burkholderiales bacterium]